MPPPDSPPLASRLRRGLAALLVAGPALVSIGQTPAESPDAALDAIVATQMRAAGIKGLGAAIIVRGEVVKDPASMAHLQELLGLTAPTDPSGS